MLAERCGNKNTRYSTNKRDTVIVCKPLVEKVYFFVLKGVPLRNYLV